MSIPLRRHPSVCERRWYTASLLLATEPVAEEADLRSTVSVGLRANMTGWLEWLVSALFSLLSFLDCRCPPVLLFSRPASRPGTRLDGRFPASPMLQIYARRFKISFPGVLVSEEKVVSFSFAFCHFTMQNVFGNAARFYALDMAKPAQAYLTKHGKDTIHVGSLAHLRVWHFPHLVDVENAPQASHVEAV